MSHFENGPQAEELLISLAGLIHIVINEGQGVVPSALQEATRHLHDQGILVLRFVICMPSMHQLSATYNVL